MKTPIISNEEILNLYRDGLPSTHIARLCGLSYTSFLRYVRFEGIYIKTRSAKGENKDKDSSNRPLCKCHNEAMRFNEDKNGKITWKCRVKARAADKKKWHAHHVSPDKRIKRLLILHDLSLDEYEGLLISQQGNCAICKKSPDKEQWKKLSIDHCHKTGKVRGLLCASCNTSLGKIEKHLDSFLSYLSLNSLSPCSLTV